MLPPGASEGKCDAVAAPAAEFSYYCNDLVLEHFKKLVETGARADEVSNVIMRAV
jgi:hypothetical protein